MKELPATLMLRPTNFETLVIRVWRAESAGYVGAAALPALILVVVSALSMFVLLSQEGGEGPTLGGVGDGSADSSHSPGRDSESRP
jgi:iron(III) transport system permease protein